MADDRAASVVLASDRGPIAFVRHGDRLVAESRPGSLPDVVRSAAAAFEGAVAWVSTTMSGDDVEADRGGRFEDLRESTGLRPDPVFIEPAEYRAYYDEAGVRMLWFAHHELWGDLGDLGDLGAGAGAGPDVSAFEAYQAVNAKLAQRVAQWCGRDTLVAFHDYQLATAPLALRRIAPRVAIAHFTHTPFAGPAALERCSPDVAARLVRGMLAADILGFQRRAWADDFLACCRRFVGADVDAGRGTVRCGDRLTWVRCYPIPIDVAQVRARSSTDHALSWAARVAAPSAGVRRIVRVDRLDPAKNVLRGFEAFELLLQQRAELRGRVSFTAFLVPSRERVAEYRAYADRTWQVVDRINARFPGTVTVHYGNDPERALGALRSYDVLLVNSVRDGMNLVALEGAAVNAAAGVIVLSARTGAADVLHEGALSLADPTDVGETAQLLERALALPLPERRRRCEQLRRAALSRSPGDWLAGQLADLAVIRDGGTPRSGAW